MRVAVALLLAACGSSEPTQEGTPTEPTRTAHEAPALPEQDVGEVLAMVGDGKIGSNAFITSASRRAPEDGKAFSVDEKRQVLEELISEEALWQESVQRGFYRDPKVRKMMVNLLLREEVYANVRASDFTQEQMKTYFDEHLEEFTVPEKVQVKRIFLQVGEERTQEEANTLAAKLKKDLTARPDSFKDLAAEHSDDPYKRRGGDLGYLSKDGKPGIDPGVIEKAFALPLNKVSDPFDAGGGVNIVLVVNKRERVERTFDQMKGSVLRKLKNDRYKEMQDAFIVNTRKRFDISVAAEKLEALTVDPGRPEADDHGHGDDHGPGEGAE
jgi:parvulin-like peptidyl-prolyl isomerase